MRLIRSKLQFIILDDFSNVGVCVFFFFFEISLLISQSSNLFIMSFATISSATIKICRTVILIFQKLFQFFGNFSVFFLLYYHLEQWRRFTVSSLLMITKFGFRTWIRWEFRISDSHGILTFFSLRTQKFENHFCHHYRGVLNTLQTWFL